MDGERFDRLARTVGRRPVVAGVAAVLLGARASRVGAAPPDPCAAVRWDEEQQRSRCSLEECAALGGCCRGGTCYVKHDGASVESCTETRGPTVIVGIGDCADYARVCGVRGQRGQRCPACVDMRSSRRHCGAYGNRCAAGERCSEGACVAAA